MKKIIFTKLLVLLLFFNVGCTTINHRLLSNTFIPPNSNVIPIKPVRSSVTIYSIMVPPTVEIEDIVEMEENMLKQVPEADAVVDYNIDYNLINWILPYPALPIYSIEIVGRGMASKVEVGKKKLR